MNKIKKSTAILLAILICLVSVPIFVFGASAPQLISADIVSSKVVVNSMAEFEVVTNKNVDKVKFVNSDGSTYLVANINDGFTNYTDSSSQRTWTITKKAQFLGSTTKTIKVSGETFGYLANSAKITFTSYLNQHDLDEGNEPQVQSAPAATGTFLQNWLSRDWTQARWDTEFKGMAEAGMDYMILQSVSDVVYKTDGMAYAQNYTKYAKDFAVSAYPSSVSLFAGTNNGIDSVERCLISAKKYGIKVYLGTPSDNRWWLFGWGNLTADSASANMSTDSYFAKWVSQNADMCCEVIEELYDRYYSRYSDTIEGFYYYNEVWNFQTACNNTDNGAFVDIMSTNLNKVLAKSTSLSPDLKFMVSPFYNTTVSTAEQYGDFWAEIFANTNFRQGDIFAPQDCVGGFPDSVENNTLETWTSALKDAADTDSKIEFWSNNENFNPEFGPALLDRFIEQIEITSKYASKNICFSWNHYYSPVSENEGYHETYKDYLANNKLETQVPTAPTVTASGKTLKISGSTDNIGVCGYYVYKNNVSTLVSTLYCEDSTTKTYTASTTGTYIVVAFDFANNISSVTKVII